VDYLFGSYTNSLSENWCIFRKRKKEKKGNHPWFPFFNGGQKENISFQGRKEIFLPQELEEQRMNQRR